MNKKIAFTYLIYIVLLLLTSEFISGNQLHVSIHDPVYIYLDRLATQGVLPTYMNGTLPLTRDYISEMLLGLEQQRDHLSRVDQEILDEYLADYRHELKDVPYFKLDEEQKTYHPFGSWSNIKNGISELISYTKNQEDHHLVVYENGDDLLWLDVGGFGRYEIKNSFSQLPYAQRFKLSIIINGKLTAYSETNFNALLYNSNNYTMQEEYKGGFKLISDGLLGFNKLASFDYSTSYIQYESNYGNISLSMQPVKWGNAKSPIILSDNTNPYPILSWNKIIGRSRLSYFHGWIEPIDTLYFDPALENRSKYLVGHRWEINISKRLNIAFSELLVYGGRKPELVYFIPVILFFPVDQNLSAENQDNILWFLDGEYFPMQRLKLYGTFMMDDLSTNEIFKDFSGNHLAVQVGTHVTGSALSYPIDLRLEWTVVGPWSYTHRTVNGTYTYNGRCLGFEYGPNSQLFLLENNWWMNTRNRFSISFEQLKWGRETEEDMNDGYDFGNNPNHNYENANEEKYEYNTSWLIGDIQTTHTIRLLWEYQLSNIIGLELGFAHIKGMDESVNTMSIQVNVDY